MENRHLTEEIDFLKYWSIVKRHWLPATAVAMLPLMALLYLAFSSEKQYEASGKLKFKRENVTSALVTEAGEKIGKLDSLKVQDTPLDTEAEILQSAPIVTEVIKNLNLKDKKGELLIYEDFLKNLKVTNIPGTDILMVSYRSPSGDQSAKVVNEVMKNYLGFMMSLIHSISRLQSSGLPMCRTCSSDSIILPPNLGRPGSMPMAMMVSHGVV